MAPGSSRARTPRATIAGNATAPRATGGQIAPARRDRDRGHGRQADDDVERTARPVRQQHEARRHRPADDEGDGDEAKFEGADPHVAESRRSQRSDWPPARPQVPGGVGPPGHRRRPTDDREHARTAPDPTVRAKTQAGDTWDMAGQAPRGSRGHGRSSRPGSSSPRVAAASAAGSGPVSTRTTPRRRTAETTTADARGTGDPAGLPAPPDEGPDAG